MKLTITKNLCGLCASLTLGLLPALVHAYVEYTWTADGGITFGGSGNWTNSGQLWWDGSSAVALTYFGAAGNPATVNFTGSSPYTITKTGNSLFGAGANSSLTVTSVLKFGADSNYTIQAGSGSGNAINYSASTRHSFLVFDVGSGATLSLGGNGNQLGVYSTSDVTAGPGLVFRGPGVVNLDSGALISSAAPQSRITVDQGVTMNFNEGSVFSGVASTIAAPSTYTDLTRIALDNGRINVNGGTIIAGYSARATAAAGASGRGFGISVGAVSEGAASELTINEGHVIALGDPRSAAGNDSYAGIAIGIANTNKGGTVNVLGGVLETSNIRANVAADGEAILNLDGGTIVVTTAESAPANYTPATAAQLQTRLDGFITGFKDTDDNHVRIGDSGVTFDTSQIGANVSNRTATISSAMRGTGGLTKVGDNALRLTGANTYEGETLVDAGEFLIDGTGSLVSDIVVSSEAILGGSGYTTGSLFLQQRAVFNGHAGFMRGGEGDLILAGESVLNIDLSTLSDPSVAFLEVFNLSKFGEGKIVLNITGIEESYAYTLISVAGVNDLNLEDFMLNIGESAKYLAFSGSDLVLVPEPSTYALSLISILLLARLITVRRRKA